MPPSLGQICRLAWHRPLDASKIGFWFVTGKRVRARGRLAHALAQLPRSYEDWVRNCASRDLQTLKDDSANHPAICVHYHVDKDSVYSAMTAIDSVVAQNWPHWRLVVTFSPDVRTMEDRLPADARIQYPPVRPTSYPAALALALDAAGSGYLVPLQGNCTLPQGALAAYACVIRQLPANEQPVLYGDQDERSKLGAPPTPWFKPEWDVDMFLAQDYITAACALPASATRAIAGSVAQDIDDISVIYAIALRLAVAPQPHRFVHVQRVTASTPPDLWQNHSSPRLAILRRELGLDQNDVVAGEFGTALVRWPLPAHLPMVSIVIPTRDRLDLLKPCVEGVLTQTSYRNFEIIIADNDSVEPDTLEFFESVAKHPQVKVISWPYPYNYSAINNFAVQAASGEFVCLLNNDVEIIDGEWLGELMRHACREGVGAVGSRLLYPDMSIQHAGVVVGLGNAAGHAHRGLQPGQAGYFANALVARGATAVTAACLVVSRELFDKVGGLDEDHLRIAYNDVDLCLKVRRTGARNIYAPASVCIHHESKSRGLDMAPEHLARYMIELGVLQERWGTKTFHDPMHHPMLDRSSEVYRFG